MGYSSRFLWWMHHRLALIRPRLGELVAFRSFVREIPADTAVDEAAIEAIVGKAGYRIVYAERACVRNKGPETMREYFVQRRRIIAGHQHLRHTRGYSVSSQAILLILGALARKFESHAWTALLLLRRGRFGLFWKYVRRHVVRTAWAVAAVGMEAAAWALGNVDYYVFHRNPFIWEVARSTKKLQ
jgi:cellulose synthase/poly-beta-1,6-N-acetylglucosamine synthase-like glycosyltransferase